MILSTTNLDRILLGVLASFHTYPLRRGRLRVSKYLTDGKIYYVFEIETFVLGYTEDWEQAQTLARLAEGLDFESFYRLCRIGY